MKIGDTVKVIGGNNEVGQPTMMGRKGIIKSVGTEYTVEGRMTRETYVEFEHFGLHIFNDYHLEVVKLLLYRDGIKRENIE